MPTPQATEASTQPPVQASNEANFSESLPEDLRGDATLQKFKDVGGLAKSYLELQKMTGSSVRIPGENATPEEQAKFFARLGRPESPEKYALQRPELPEGMKWDEKLEGEFRSTAHQIGLNDKQAQALLGWYSKWQLGQMENFEAGMKQTEEALKKEWGGDYEGKKALAQRAVVKLVDEEAQNILLNTALGNNASLIKLFARVGEILGESPSPHGESSMEAGASEEILAIMNNPKHAYWNDRDSGHEEAVQKMKALREKALKR